MVQAAGGDEIAQGHLGEHHGLLPAHFGLERELLPRVLEEIHRQLGGGTEGLSCIVAQPVVATTRSMIAAVICNMDRDIVPSLSSLTLSRRVARGSAAVTGR